MSWTEALARVRRAVGFPCKPCCLPHMVCGGDRRAAVLEDDEREKTDVALGDDRQEMGSEWEECNAHQSCRS